jgi:hypothetical protein
MYIILKGGTIGLIHYHSDFPKIEFFFLSFRKRMVVKNGRQQQASGLVKRIILIIKDRKRYVGDSWKSSEKMLDHLLGLREFSRNKRNPLRKVVEEGK